MRPPQKRRTVRRHYTGKRKLNRSTTQGKSDKHFYGDQQLDLFDLSILWLFMYTALRPKPKQKQY